MLDGLMILPSDMFKRPDIAFMLEKDWTSAETAKVEMEETQRNDRKLKEKAAKLRK